MGRGPFVRGKKKGIKSEIRSEIRSAFASTGTGLFGLGENGGGMGSGESGAAIFPPGWSNDRCNH
jgi:hypothetical protein